LNNAIKFTNDFGRVKIIVNNSSREIEIIISDTGIGIPDKDLPYIFQRFYRASRPGADVPGTGVGLVFVKQVVDLHKGLITVQSDVDNGTTFMVKLPKTSKIEKN
jgi:two-component system sensor histidine kinase ResE